MQKVHRIRAQTLEARFQISPNDIGLPDVIEFQMVLPLRVNTPAFGGEIKLTAA